MRTRWMYTVAVVTVLMLAAGCGGSSAELAEIKDTQRKILAKLDDVEKKIGQAVQPRVAPAPVDPNKIYDLPAGDSPVRGAENAPVVLTEFSDFQCPFCSKVPSLMAEVWNAYPNQIKFVFKQFPLPMHKDAMNAARASLAAKRQGKFWEMHDKMFANQRGLEPESLKKYAQEIGIDVAKFEADMMSKEVQNQIDADMRLAQSVQVSGTPTLFLNGKRISDRSPEGLKQLVGEAIKAKG